MSLGAQSCELPARLDDFELLEELGRGGMGVVYRARQVSLDREVALKVLPVGLGIDEESVLRFQHEAEATARLTHPSLVPVHAFGELEGVHWYAMGLVNGPSLHALLLGLRDRQPEQLLGSLAEETALDVVCPTVGAQDPPCLVPGSRYAWSCAAIMAQVAEGLAAAHEREVVHRDLKPGNVLIHSDGRVVVVDFGLARDLQAAHLTRTGDAVGTPTYMAPEQAAGDKDADVRADVWGIGIVLYELLALRPPFEADSASEVMRRIVSEDVPPVRRFNPRVPPELADIVHQCLMRVPSDRYEDAGAVAADLKAFLRGDPISARRAARRQWLSFFRRRRRGVRAALLAVILSTTAAISAGWAWWNELERRGAAALERAAHAASIGDFRALPEAYGNAAAHLGEAFVEQTRQAHLKQFFERHYEAGAFEGLQEWLEQFDADDAYVAGLIDRVEGVGEVRVLGGEGLEVEIRRVPFEESARWHPLVSGPAATGAFVVRGRGPEGVEVRRAVRIDRDLVVDLGLPAIRQLRPETVSTRWGDQWVAADRRPWTAGRYSRFLRDLEDDQLRRELLPLGWQDNVPPGSPDEVLVGLSKSQARRVAALSGGHLPQHREFWAVFDPGTPAAPPVAAHWLVESGDDNAAPTRRLRVFHGLSLNAAKSTPLGPGMVRLELAESGSCRIHWTEPMPSGGVPLGIDGLHLTDITRYRDGVLLAPDEPVGSGDTRSVAVSGALDPTEGLKAMPGGAWQWTWRLGSGVGFEWVLPPTARVVDVQPAPDRDLLWEPVATERLIRVVFRVDGELNRRSMAEAIPRGIVTDFLAAWNDREGAAVEAVPASEDFVAHLGGEAFGFTTDGERAGTFGNVTFDSIVPLGTGFDVSVRADWSVRGRRGVVEELKAWPLRIVLRHDATTGTLQVSRLQTAAWSDRGLLRDQFYRRPQLGLSFEAPPGATMHATADLPVDVQFQVRPPVDEGTPGQPCVLIAAVRFEDGDESTRSRLTGGEELIRTGEMMTGPSRTLVGPEDEAAPAPTTHWLFQNMAENAFERTSWTWVRGGSRLMLVRCTVTGETRDEARAAFGAAQPFFREVFRRIQF